MNNAVINDPATLLARTKPDFAEVRERWRHFWAGEVDRRPLVLAAVAKDPAKGIRGKNHDYYLAINRRYDELGARIDEWLATTDFLGEMVPCVRPDLGPDQYAAFFGADLRCNENSPDTAWVDPVVDDWEEFLPLKLDPENKWWRQIQELSRVLAEHSQGRYLVGTIDLHSNADALSALRGPQNFCMDFLDSPNLLERAMQDVRATYPVIYNALYEAGGMSPHTGTSGWIPFWCEGRYTVIQCDFICMVSPEASRRFIIPALEEEAGFLDHCVYHLDGPDALVHLDDILAIDAIDVIQWVSGAGQKSMHLWTDVLQKCRDAGKGLVLYPPDLDAVKELHRAFGPERMAYQVGGTRQQVEEIMNWLEKNS